MEGERRSRRERRVGEEIDTFRTGEHRFPLVEHIVCEDHRRARLRHHSPHHCFVVLLNTLLFSSPLPLYALLHPPTSLFSLTCNIHSVGFGVHTLRGLCCRSLQGN